MDSTSVHGVRFEDWLHKSKGRGGRETGKNQESVLLWARARVGEKANLKIAPTLANVSASPRITASTMQSRLLIFSDGRIGVVGG